MSRAILQFLQDLRYATRQLRRAPGFTASILLVLGLGIGANAAIFSILNVTLLRQLPFTKPGELVTLHAVDDKGLKAWSAFPDLRDWQKQNHTLSSVAYFSDGHGYLDAPAGQQKVSATAISPNFLATLGVAPVLGRDFSPDEEAAGKNNVILLSHDLWRTQFHADSNAIGQTVLLDGEPQTIVGIMPSGFAFPQGDRDRQIWTPATVSAAADSRTKPAPQIFDAIARLQPGVDIAAAQSDLSTIKHRLRPLYAGTFAETSAATQVKVDNYRASLDQNNRPALLALIAAVGLIWLIACANAANLMVARGNARQREIAVRGALGASRVRVIRQLLTESLLLSLGSAALGLGFGLATLRLFAHSLLTQLNLPHPPAFDVRVLAALFGLTLLSTILFGLAPALLATNIPIEHALRQNSSQTGSSRSSNRLQRTLVVTEIALSLTLLVACGLLLRTVFALRQVPLGIRTDHIVLVEPSIPAYKYKGTDLNRVLYQPLIDRIRAMHGVQAAALTTVAPLDTNFSMNLSLYMSKSDSPDKVTSAGTVNAKMIASTADLKNVFGFRIKQGRYFGPQDTPSSHPVMLVNEAFAKAYQSALGKSPIGNFGMNLSKDRSTETIGIVEDFRQVGVDQPAAPEMELLASQLQPTDGFYQPTMQAHIQLAIRTSQSTDAFLPDLHTVLASANPDLRSATVITMDQVVEDSIGPQLLAAHLLETFGGLALLVALAGLYSLLAYIVTLRKRELGLRMALGADRADILHLMFRQAAVLVTIGIAVGVALSLTTTHLLEHFLFGTKPRDTATFLTAATLMAAVSLFAAWLPARRAASIEPMEALRAE